MVWELQPGDLVDGKYEVLERLHGGSMADVYLVRHVYLQAMRVIKLLQPAMAADREVAERFQREARIATRVEHPHVATLHDYSQLDDGTFLMVWEHIQGESIADWLERRGPFSVAVALELADQGLRGLGAIHAAGVLHQDVSPDNLLLGHDPSGSPWLKIVDLGLSRAVRDATELASGGKFLYCSPEQAQVVPGAAPDHRSDLYSFALVLYEMMSGERPWEDIGLGEGLAARFREAPIPLSARRPDLDLPPAVETVVMRALARHPIERWASAADFADALEKVRVELGLRPTSARTGSGSGEAAVDVASLIGRADEAIREGRLDEAEAILDGLDRFEPPPLGLADLRRVLRETSDRRRRMQVLQTEELLEQYLLAGRKSLAEMALSVLFELEPDHERRSELEWRVESLHGETDTHGRPEILASAARRSLARGELSEAHDWVDRLEQAGGSASLLKRLRSAVEEAEREQRQQTEARRLRERIDELLEAGRVESAERELGQLESLGVPKTVLDVYRARIAEVRRRTRDRWQARMIEMGFPQLLEAQQWEEAREAAMQLGRLDPGSGLPAKMLAEIARREERASRVIAVDAGVQTVERYLSEGHGPNARIALDVLLRLAPDHPERARLERAVQELETQSPR